MEEESGDRGERLTSLVWKEPINGKTAFFTEEVYRRLMGPEPSLEDKVSQMMDKLGFPPAARHSTTHWNAAASHETSPQRNTPSPSSETLAQHPASAGASSTAVKQEDSASSSSSAKRVKLDKTNSACSARNTVLDRANSVSPSHHDRTNSAFSSSSKSAGLDAVNSNSSSSSSGNVQANSEESREISSFEIADTPESPTASPERTSVASLASLGQGMDSRMVSAESSLDSADSAGLVTDSESGTETKMNPGSAQNRGLANDSQMTANGSLYQSVSSETNAKKGRNSDKAGATQQAEQPSIKIQDKTRKTVLKEAPKSCLSHEQHQRYLALFKKCTQRFFSGGFTLPPTPSELKELQEFESLQMKVAQEQEQCQSYLRQVSEVSPYLYTHLPAHFTHYTQEREQGGWKRVEGYCRYYSLEGQLPLNPDPSHLTSDSAPMTPQPTLTLVQTLLELGSKSRLVMPDMTPNPTARNRRTVVTEVQRVKTRFPPVHPSNQPCWNHEPASKDVNMESLVRKYPCHIATSASVLKQLVDNHGPDFGVSWDIPVVIKECGHGSASHRVVFLDKPLIPTVSSLSERKAVYLKKAVRAQICQPQHERKSGPARTRNTKQAKGQMTTPGETTQGWSVSLDNDDDPFGSACMDDLETFGSSVTLNTDSKRRVTSSQNAGRCGGGGFSTGVPTLPLVGQAGDTESPQTIPTSSDADVKVESTSKPSSESTETTQQIAPKLTQNENPQVEIKSESEATHSVTSETNQKADVAATSVTKSTIGWKQDSDSDSDGDALVIADVNSPVKQAGDHSNSIRSPSSAIRGQHHAMTRRSQERRSSIFDDVSPSASASTKLASGYQAVAISASKTTSQHQAEAAAASKTTSQHQAEAAVASNTVSQIPSVADSTCKTPSQQKVGLSPATTAPSGFMSSVPAPSDAFVSPYNACENRSLTAPSRRITRSLSHRLVSSGESGGESGCDGGCGGGDVFGSPPCSSSATVVATSVDSMASPQTTRRQSAKRKQPTTTTTGQVSEVMASTETEGAAILAKKGRTTGDGNVGTGGGGGVEVTSTLGKRGGCENLAVKSEEKPSVVEAPPSYLDSLLSTMTPVGGGGRVRLQEDPGQYRPPGSASEQVSYQLWDLGGTSLIVRCNGHAFIRDDWQQQREVYVSSKPERQMPQGVEQNTLSESVRSWLSCYLRPHSYLLRARVNVQNYEVVHLEELQLNQILPPSLQFSPQCTFAVLKSIFNRLTELPAGSFLLSHEAGANHIHLKSATDVRRGSYDLRSHYLGLVMQEPSRVMSFVPVDPTIVLPHHWRLGLIPATFQPQDFKQKKQHQHQHQHGPKRKKHFYNKKQKK